MTGSHTFSLQQAMQIARRHYDAGRLRKSGNICRKVLDINPEHPRALHLLGLVYYKKGENTRAAELLARAVNGRPERPHFQNDLGAALSALGRHEEALAVYRTALGLAQPQHSRKIGIHRNIALALQRLGRNDEALACHAQALAISPDDADTLWNRSHIYLARGQFEAGWDGYESRLDLPDYREVFKRHRGATPHWDGSPFSGKTLLVMDEQGLGDMLQFVRFLPQVKQLGGRVVLETRQRLKAIMASAAGFDEIINRMQARARLAEFDLFIPIMSLPRLLGVRLDTLPATTPYLHPDKNLIASWRRRLDTDQPNVGLVWTGNMENIALRHRSMRLAQLGECLKVPGLNFHSLQFGEAASQIKDLPAGIRINDLSKDIGPFEQQAAAVASMDLVITVDTAMAHLAGALGIPTWVMLSHPPDWRWMLERSDSPWYPGMQLFRQNRTGHWDEVLRQIKLALESLAHKA